MRTSQIEFVFEEGLHSKPATRLVNQANQFQSSIHIKHNNKTVNAKSIMGVLMLSLHPGAQVEIEVDGTDEKEALEVISTMLAGDFE